MATTPSDSTQAGATGNSNAPDQRVKETQASECFRVMTVLVPHPAHREELEEYLFRVGDDLDDALPPGQFGFRILPCEFIPNEMILLEIYANRVVADDNQHCFRDALRHAEDMNWVLFKPDIRILDGPGMFAIREWEDVVRPTESPNMY
ncbi:hypothetical protein VTK26DRAFT_9514 [Humicola hyalothermophila]